MIIGGRLRKGIKGNCGDGEKRGEEAGREWAGSAGLGRRTDCREKFSSGTITDTGGGGEPPIFPSFHILLGNLPRLSN